MTQGCLLPGPFLMIYDFREENCIIVDRDILEEKLWPPGLILGGRFYLSESVRIIRFGESGLQTMRENK
jgi:hypothetical protein